MRLAAVVDLVQEQVQQQPVAAFGLEALAAVHTHLGGEGAQARDGCSEAESIDTALALAATARSAREGGWANV